MSNDKVLDKLNEVYNDDKTLEKGRIQGFWWMWAVVLVFALLSWAFAPSPTTTTFIDGQFVRCANTAYSIWVCEEVER